MSETPGKVLTQTMTPSGRIKIKWARDQSKVQAKAVGKIDPSDPKVVNTAEKIAQKIADKHDRTDEELFQQIQVKPENADKKTHLLDREQQDARLVLMHRLLIRKVSPTDIQKQLGISPEMYYYLKPKLDASLRLDLNKLDVPYMIGDTLALYDEVRSMALTMASSQSVKDPRVKVAAMSVVLKAEQDKNNFLATCGVYAPQIVEHLIRGMVTAGATAMLSGEHRDRTKNVEEMVGDLMDVLAGNAHHFKAGQSDGDVVDAEVQSIAERRP